MGRTPHDIGVAGRLYLGCFCGSDGRFCGAFGSGKLASRDSSVTASFVLPSDPVRERRFHFVVRSKRTAAYVTDGRPNPRDSSRLRFDERRTCFGEPYEAP